MNWLTTAANVAQILSLLALLPLAWNAVVGGRARCGLAAVQDALIRMEPGAGVIVNGMAHPRGVPVERGSSREAGARLGMQIGVLKGKWQEGRLFVWLA